MNLVINALRIAGGEADCSTCPACRVCGKQCLAIADAVAGMIRDGNLPSLKATSSPPDPESQGKGNGGDKKGKGNLKIIK